MGHFRLCALMLVEEIIKTLCIQTPIIIQDMCILLCDHRSLCMAGVTLNSFDITAVQFEFVCNTGVSEAVKDHFGEIVFLNQPLQCQTAELGSIMPSFSHASKLVLEIR